MIKRLLLAAFAALSLCVGAAAQDAGGAWDPAAPYPTDIVVGLPEAPVTVVEYASLTCPHCARFQAESWPAFKKGWVDTGKAKLVFRHLPLDQSALAGALTASCLPAEKRHEFVEALFSSVAEWAPEQHMAPVLGRVLGEKADFPAIMACIAAEGFPEKVMQPGTDAVNNGVEATPTFFVNGEMIPGFRTAEELGKLVDDRLADSLFSE